MESLKEIQIVLERCSRTETAISAMMKKKKVKKCDICGCSISNDKTESAEDKLSPLQFNLLLTIMDSVEESRKRMEDIVPNNSSACANCISRFRTLELLYAEICALQNKVDDILAQILKIIQDRLKLVDSTETTKEVEDPSSKAHLSSISVPPPPIRSSSCGDNPEDDKEEDTTQFTPTTVTTDSDCINTAFTLDEEEDNVLNIKEELDLDDELQSPEEVDYVIVCDGDHLHPEPLEIDIDPVDPEPIKLEDDPLHLDVDPVDPEPNPTDKSSRQRQCKIRAQQVISSILKNDLPTVKPTKDKDNHGDEDENYSSNNDTDMDSSSSPSDSESEQSLLEEQDYGKRKRVRNRPPQSEQKHTCEICGKWVPGLFTLSQHMETHKNRSERRTFPCQKCGKTFLEEHSLHQHMKSIHDNTRPFKCQQCDKGFNLEKRLQIHMKAKHNPDNRPIKVRNRPPKSEQKHTCEICGKWVPGLSRFSPHMETHKNKSERRTFPCHKCGKRFFSKSYLNEHMRYVHDKIRPIKCQQCGKEFSNKKSLKRHIKSKHNPELKGPFICPFCGRGYPTKIKLQRHHQYVHMREHRIKCIHPTCRNIFNTESALQHHLKHYHPVDDENKTRCTICNESFATVREKVVHILRIHEKAFTCKFCDKSYSDKLHLNIHERNHTGDQPYLCTRCGKTFAQDHTLKVHQRVTCNEDTTEADKIRKARSKRQMEWRAKKKNSHFKCDFCLKTFLLKERLVLHISKVHKDEAEQDHGDEKTS